MCRKASGFESLLPHQLHPRSACKGPIGPTRVINRILTKTCDRAPSAVGLPLRGRRGHADQTGKHSDVPGRRMGRLHTGTAPEGRVQIFTRSLTGTSQHDTLSRNARRKPIRNDGGYDETVEACREAGRTVRAAQGNGMNALSVPWPEGSPDLA